VHLYEDTTRRPAEPPSRAPSDTRLPEPDKPAEPADIDLERALWDMEYRRQVLEILRRSRHNETDPTPRNPDHGKKGP
jgi:hypothetical protein